MLELRTEHLGDLIADIHRASKGTYGTRRVTAELRLGHEIIANRKAVRRIMLRLGLQGLPILKTKRRGPATDGAAAGDLVLRQFATDAPDRLWLTDITEHPTVEGKLYVCSIKDLCSNRIVGYAIDERMTAALAVSALRSAIARRRPVGTVIVHSDRGGQFRARSFRAVLTAAGLRGSMGRVAAAGDNAAMESFHSLLQKNVLNRQRWRTRAELRYEVIIWIERTYNRRRRQRALGKLTPVEFELSLTDREDLAA